MGLHPILELKSEIEREVSRRRPSGTEELVPAHIRLRRINLIHDVCAMALRCRRVIMKAGKTKLEGVAVHKELADASTPQSSVLIVKRIH